MCRPDNQPEYSNKETKRINSPYIVDYNIKREFVPKKDTFGYIKDKYGYEE